MRDGIGCRVDADDFARSQCQQRAAVTLALDSSMTGMIDEITHRVVAALIAKSGPR